MSSTWALFPSIPLMPTLVLAMTLWGAAHYVWNSSVSMPAFFLGAGTTVMHLGSETLACDLLSVDHFCMNSQRCTAARNHAI